jgi:hypothetical protein
MPPTDHPASFAPTLFADVNAVLLSLLEGARVALGEQFVGLYLYGSLASGGFDPTCSDIDFVVVTRATLSEPAIQALDELHQRLWQSGGKWAAKLEGSYVPLDLIRRHAPHGPDCPTVNESQFYTGGLGTDWIIQRAILRESGITIAGPEPASLIDPVSAEAVRGAVLGYLWEWWAPMLEDSERLQSREYQAYAVLSMCRALYTIQNGTIASKQDSAAWARQTLPESFHSLIDQALAFRPADEAEQPDRLEDTLDLIRLVVDASQDYRA